MPNVPAPGAVINSLMRSALVKGSILWKIAGGLARNSSDETTDSVCLRF